MSVWQWRIVLAALACASQSLGQTVPKGGDNYFGTGWNSSFNDNTFKPPPPLPAPPPPKPPAVFPPGNGLVGAPPGGPPAGLPPPAGGLLPAAPPPPSLWKGGAEIGVNGSQGNSETFNLRLGANLGRKTANNIFASDFLYNYARNNGMIQQQQALINARDEILCPSTPWSAFASTNIEYDQLRAYRFLIGVYGGVGRVLIDDEQVNWRVRAGAGAVRQIGRNGTASRWTPEALFGTDFTWRLDDRQSFIGTLDYYPRLDDWRQFRVRARAAYQIILDKGTGTTLRLGVQDRYDSSAGGNAKRNDLNYYACLGFTF